ncbi:7-cyano-7-deazaguanine synthase [Actinacidiphila sp. bgisy144]|uniref:7-cyano-7-deazaguanine synthase n=1 Tax=Actinacidiphila sp. bgisy144 TaxID=3413791 RepID=UPI003EBCB8AD
MTDSTNFVWWRGHRGDGARDPRWKEVGEDSFQEREGRISGRHQFPGPIPDWAEDLFRVARAVFVSDKYVRRTDSLDRWTRNIRLSVPVTDVGSWRTAAVRTHLTTLLQLLTGDVWEIDFRHLTLNPVQEAMADATQPQASEVALFSGGLDSLSWAATRANADDSRPLLLVMFREIGLLRLQRRVYEAARQLERIRDVLLLPMSQTPRGDGSGTRLETSSRTRGLLYATGAIRVASAHGVPTVHIPENGQLALNPALTPARSAALSTRSVHPWTLHHLNALVTTIANAGDAVRVINPLARLTKGEVCVAALDAGLTASDLESTLSCGKPPARRNGGPRLANCGVCFPCLVRRSGLLKANDRDGTAYEALPWAESVPFPRTADWRALQRWLFSPYSSTDLLTDRPLPPDVDIAEAFDVIQRGRNELARLLSMAGSTSAA